MKRIEVALGERSYDILIGEGLIDRAADHLAPFAREGRLMVVSDDHVWSLLGNRLRAGLPDIEVLPILVAAGEQSKSWNGLSTVVEELLARGIERADHVVAFGGGVVGDLAGLAAALVNRGCRFINIPTTLLAQVDSSVGGKTAINARSGKNLVGVFHQPSAVLIDPLATETLSARQLRAGYAEIVKYALIEDRAFFAWLDSASGNLLGSGRETRGLAIATAVAGKARIVAADERETKGRRALLNLGHTFGHALEAETGYSERLLHGEAVALGCVLAFDFSVSLGFCDEADARSVRAHLRDSGLPTSLGEIGLDRSGARLASHMRYDKKRRDGRTPLVLARGIGEAFLCQEVELAEVAAFLDAAQ